jgi:YjbE family integral membrane protein
MWLEGDVPVTGEVSVAMLSEGGFWIALLQIIWINILLSGDNAVVIALACRQLPKRQQTLGIVLGTLPAIILRIVFTIFIAYLMGKPYLKLVGGALLFWVAVKMLQPEEEGGDEVKSSSTIWAAVRTIVIADAVMSLDNVIAIAAAAGDNKALLVIGLLISMPLVIFGSAMLLKLLTRFPLLVTAGGALLGWIAGDVMITDPVLVEWVEQHAPALHTAVPAAGAAAVVLIGYVLSRLTARRKEYDIVT